jgi:drug/metabolite transporter (DMT)-like permease
VTWSAIAYLAVVTSVVSYFLWYYALGKMTASKVAVFSNLQPVATALAAWAFLHEPLTWEIALGGALVLAGVWLTQGGALAAPSTVG